MKSRLYARSERDGWTNWCADGRMGFLPSRKAESCYTRHFHCLAEVASFQTHAVRRDGCTDQIANGAGRVQFRMARDCARQGPLSENRLGWALESVAEVASCYKREVGSVRGGIDFRCLAGCRLVILIVHRALWKRVASTQLASLSSQALPRSR